MRATLAVGRCMRIPTSVVAVVLLLAIPMIASFMSFVSDSTIKRSPRMNIFPVTSRLEAITVVSVVVEMNDSFKKLSAATYGTAPTVKPSILTFPPTSMFAVVMRPVAVFVNRTTFVVAFPISVMFCRDNAVPPVAVSRF